MGLVYLIVCLLDSALSMIFTATFEADILNTPTLQMKKLSPRGRRATNETTCLLGTPMPLGSLVPGKS